LAVSLQESSASLSLLFPQILIGFGRSEFLTLPEGALSLLSLVEGRHFGLQGSLGLTLGQYREEPSHVETGRVLFELNASPMRRNLTRRTSFSLGGGFRQYAYGDGTAQYVVSANTELSRQIGRNSSAILTYRYLEPRGFTPFRFDFVGRTNVVAGSFNLRESERFKLSLAGGYDFRYSQNPWQDASLRVFFSTGPAFAFYTSTAYDLNRSHWRAVVNQYRIRLPNNFRLDIGTRYDPQRGRFSSVKGQLDTPLGRFWRLQAVAGYSGFTNRFDYRSIMLTRDLHCWEASLLLTNQSGFFQQNEVRLNLRIKAFPLFQQFGVGAFGQSLDTSVGEVF